MSLQEHVQRLDALAQALFQQRPFLAREDAGDDVERDQPFLGVGLAIDGEGDADPAEQELGFLATIFEGVRGVSLSQRESSWIGRAEVAPGTVHLIKRNCHRTRLFVSGQRNSA